MSEALNMLQQLDNRKFKVFYYIKLADIVVEEFEPKLTILCLSKYLWLLNFSTFWPIVAINFDVFHGDFMR